MKKKQAFTLLEIMIVIFLIGLIGSIVGYNMKGSLNEGKAFKTEQAMLRLHDIFELEMARNNRSPQNVVDDKENVIMRSGLVKNPSLLLKDGWGNNFTIRVDSKNRITIVSQIFRRYKTKKGEQQQLSEIEKR